MRDEFRTRKDKPENAIARASSRPPPQSDVYVIRNTFAAGGSSGWHTHPGPSLITVTKGEITAYEGDDRKCRPKDYRAGEGSSILATGTCICCATRPARPRRPVQILPKGAPRRIDAPDPGNCPF